MPNFTSPGVYTFENDTSFYAPSINPTIVGIAGFAARGPVGEATLLTTPADLLRTFGNPDQVEGGQGIAGALEILEQSNQLYYVRVATDEVANAREDILWGTCPNLLVYYKKMDKDTAYRIDVTVRDNENNVIGAEATPVYIYRERPGVAGAVAGSKFTDATTSATAWNETLTRAVGEAFGGVDGAASVYSDEFSGWVVGRDAGAQAKIQVVNSYIASATPAGDALDFDGASVSATPWSLADFDWQMLKDTQTTSALNFTITFSGAGVKPSDANLVDGIGANVFTASGTSYAMTMVPSGTFGGYRMESQYGGLGYNYSATTNEIGQPIVKGLRAVVTGGAEGRNYIAIESEGSIREEFAVRNFQSSTAGESLWPEDVINQGIDNATSQYIKASFKVVSGAASEEFDGNLSAVVSAPALATAPPSTWYQEQAFSSPYVNRTGNLVTPGTTKNVRFVKLVSDNYDLAYGKNGDASDYAGDLTDNDITTAFVGNAATKTGMYAFDVEDVPVTLVGVPGISTQNIQNALVTLAEKSQKFLAVLGTPLGFSTAQQAINWTNGNATGRTAALNSSYAAVYWPWVKVFNAFTGRDEFYDPAIFAIRQMCLTDRVSESWFAPAGLLRGRLTKPTDVEVKLSQGDRDALYGGGNVVNPIVKFNTDGIAIYGQRTTQRVASALDRINVRRLMIYLRRLILDATRPYVFEPNDPILWEAIRETLNPALADIQSRRGITSYKVTCDESTNTPLRIDRNELWCKVQIKPTKAAEVLVFELNVTNQQANI